MLSSDPFVAVEAALTEAEKDTIRESVREGADIADFLGDCFERDLFLIFTEPCSRRGAHVVRELAAGELDPDVAAGKIHEAWTGAVICAGILIAADGVHRFATGAIISDLSDVAERITRLAVEGEPE